MKKILLIITISVLLSVSFVSGFLLTKKDKVKEVVKEVPIPNDFIANPALQQLSANIKGTVTEINKAYFILEENGKKVTLYYEPNGLSTFSDRESGSEIIYSQIVAGDYLEGGVSIIISRENAIGRTGNRNPGDVIAHSFLVTKIK